MIDLVKNFMERASDVKAGFVEAYNRNEDKILATFSGIVAAKIAIEQEFHPVGIVDNIGTALGIVGIGVLGKAFLNAGFKKIPDKDTMFDFGGSAFALTSAVLIAGHFSPNPFS